MINMGGAAVNVFWSGHIKTFAKLYAAVFSLIFPLLTLCTTPCTLLFLAAPQPSPYSLA